MNIQKENKFSLNNWLTDKLKISKKKEYKDKLLSEILNFSDKVKGDIQNKVQENDHIVPILNGLNGDLFEENNEPLAIKIHFRYNNQDILLNKLADYYDFRKLKGKVNNSNISSNVNVGAKSHIENSNLGIELED